MKGFHNGYEPKQTVKLFFSEFCVFRIFTWVKARVNTCSTLMLLKQNDRPAGCDAHLAGYYSPHTNLAGVLYKHLI